MRSCSLTACAFGLLALGLSGCGSERPAVEVRVSQLQMGMRVDLIVWAPDVKTGQQACAAAFQRISQLNLIYSDYEPDSELSRLCRQAGAGPVKVSRELFTVLTVAQAMARLTDGYYDVTAAPVVRLWRQARRDHARPDPALLAHALARVGYDKLVLDAAAQTASLAERGMALDLGSIAKGYVGDEAIAALRSLGFPRAAFIAGGDMVFGEAPPGRKGWPVQPAKPGLPVMELGNCAFSVSGDTEQFLELAGQRFSHVIDARTGWALTNHTMCLVRAPTGLLSDPLATVGTILPEREFRDLLRQHFPTAQSW
jgi:FAD:protein FMN transferase